MSDNVRVLPVSGLVGFDSLPDQFVKSCSQSGFNFNIICVGETGVGKSKLMESLFNTNFNSTAGSGAHNSSSVELQSQTYELEEGNVQLKLTIVDTVGYGDQIDKENSFKPIIDYLDAQFEAFLQEELKIERCLPLYHDTRIHVCLYFVCPTGHGLKSLDLMCMKKLDTKVNIIPIIAKADSLTKTELKIFKERINKELASNGVKVYNFSIDDESVAGVNAAMNEHLPFSVIGGSDFVRVGNKMLKARQYPWGTAEVENEGHCDFVKLREMLIRTNMLDLQEQTNDKHYELYRKTRLEQMTFGDTHTENESMSFLQICVQKMALLQKEFVQREKDLKQQFEQRYRDKMEPLRESETKLLNNCEKRIEEYEKEKKKVDNNRKILEGDIEAFERLKVCHATQKLAGEKSRSHHTLPRGFKPW